MGKKPAGGLNLEALAENSSGEIFVSFDLDEIELVQGTRIDAVSHMDGVGSSFLLDLHSRVKMAAALEIVEQVAPTFIQQVFIKSILFVDRNVFFQDAAADMKPLGADEDHGSGLKQIGIVDRVGSRFVLLFSNGNLGQDAFLLLKFSSQTLKRIGDAGGGNAITGVHPGNVLNLSLGESCVAGEFDLANVGRFSSRNVDENIDLLVGGVRSAFGGDACAIIAVLLHELAHVSQGAFEFVGSIKLAEFKLCGVDDLVRVGMAGSAFHINGSDKEVERGGESQHHARAGRSNVSLDIGKAAGGEQDSDAFADLVAVERLARFLWEDLEQVAGVRHAGEFDGFDGASVVSSHRGQSCVSLSGLRLRRGSCRGRCGRASAGGWAEQNNNHHE